jgi:heptosyltransferase-2
MNFWLSGRWRIASFQRVTNRGEGQMLVVAPERWDEACFAVPAVRALAASGLKVGVLCPERQKDFWQKAGGTQVLDVAEKTNAKTLAGEIAGKWSAAVFWETGKGADAAVRAKIAKRIGPEEKELKKLLTNPAHIAKDPGPVEHRVRRYLALVEKLGMSTGRPEFYAAVGAGGQPGTVLLCPDSDFGPTYEWSLERWVEVAKALLEKGKKITVVGLPGGRNLGKQLAANLGQAADFQDLGSLGDSLELLGSHETVLAAEGSVPHLAAFAGAVCVTLFGPGDPTSRRPLGRQHGIARKHAECSPCFLTKCPMDLRCQNELTVERVLAALAI